MTYSTWNTSQSTLSPTLTDGSNPSSGSTLSLKVKRQVKCMENQGFFTRMAERERKRKKARALSINSGCLKSDHMGPHYHRVKVGWENDIDFRSYWLKAQQPINAWNLKTSH